MSLPHLSADVLAHQYLAFYRQLIPSQIPIQNITRNGSVRTESGEAIV